MNVSKIGIRNRFIIPAVMSLPLIMACGGKNEQNKIYTEPVQDEYIAQAPKKSKEKGLIFTGAGFLIGLGLAGVGTMSEIRLRKKELKTKQVFYKNNPTMAKFEPIEGEKAIKKFKEKRQPLMDFYHKMLISPCGFYAEDVDVNDYLKRVNAFTENYPDREAILTESIKPLMDTRLTPDERTYLFIFMLKKGMSTDEEWAYEYHYNYLNTCDSYEDIVHRVLLMRMLEARTKTDADNEETSSTVMKEEANDTNKVHFAQVGGQDKAIGELKKGILYPIKYPKAFKDTHLEHGFVLYGPPGTGKTLLAEALSNESKAYFVKINGPELESKWVGETEENWRKLFDEARENQPSIIFVDEFDAVASTRGKGDIHGDKALNQLLGLISDIKPDEQIFIIAATNRLDNIDPAFIRSGRLGTHIELKSPDTEEAVKSIFEIHISGKKIDKDVNSASISKELFNLRPSGADIAYIVNEARENSFSRLKIYEKMDNDSLTDDDIANITINTEDFMKAIDDFHKKKFSKTQIGFGK